MKYKILLFVKGNMVAKLLFRVYKNTKQFAFTECIVIY